MTAYLYRVRITAYPNGAFEGDGHPECESFVPVQGWSPPGWQPKGNYVEILGTSQFVWPTTTKLYRSRSTAKKRAQLLESFGATAVIERSSKITWPESDENGSEGENFSTASTGSFNAQPRRGTEVASRDHKGTTFADFRSRLNL